MSVHQRYPFPEVGEQDAYLLYHEELESLLPKHSWTAADTLLDDLFERYLTHLRVLENVDDRY